MLCISEFHRRLQDGPEYVRLYHLQQRRNVFGHIRGHIRGYIHGRLFRQGGHWQPNDKLGPFVIRFKQRHRSAIALSFSHDFTEAARMFEKKIDVFPKYR